MPSPSRLSALGASALRAAWCAIPLACACRTDELPGHYWDVTTDGVENLCTGGGADYHEEFEYRGVFEGNDLTLAIGEDIFATGTIEGCSVSYDSLAWSDYREGKEIKWQIAGTARVNVGGAGGCVEGTDWEGTETFIVTESAHPDVSPGCTYTLNVSGTYLREVAE
ncbi:MAG: hypothetical protein ABMB14_10650 [Myxococcota bacterium]